MLILKMVNKMSKDPKYNTVAKAVGMQVDNNSDDLYIVFKITDEAFKQKIRENWLDDIELKMFGKELFEKE